MNRPYFLIPTYSAPIYHNCMITQDKIDNILNALMVGMALEDAYVFASLTPTEITEAADNEEYQALFASTAKNYEYGLLSKLNAVIDKQKNMGKEGAVTWALEHMYPRYTNKNPGDGQPITINFGTTASEADVEYDT